MELFNNLERQYGLPSGLLDAVWSAESGRGRAMLSPAGAQGHFQFMPATAKQYGLTDPSDLTQSAGAAARMFSDLLKQTGGDLKQALAGYNWGIGNLQRKGLDAAPAETRNYIQKVSASMPTSNQSDDAWGALVKKYSSAPEAPAQKDDPWAALSEKYARAPQPEQPIQAAPAAKADIAPQQQGAPSEAGRSFNNMLSEIPRQIGLTSRYGLEGLANAAQVFTEPVAGLMRGAGINTAPLGQVATSIADAVGLPKPQTPLERVVGDATRLVAGAGGTLGGAQQLAKLPGLVGSVGSALSAAPTAQLTSAAGGGGLSGLSREGGGDELQQAAAGLIGGVAGGFAPGLVQGAASGVKRALTPKMTPQQLDAQINVIFERSGGDYSQIPERARQALRTELRSALQAGKEVNADAVRRLADFQATGLTPTRGMVTQDPVQITREMNLAKMGASSADDQLQGMARIQNQNNTRLIGNLNEAGASRGDQFRAGESAIGSILGRDAQKAASVTGLYDQARDTAGRSAQLNGRAFADNVSKVLDQNLLGGALPPQVEQHINRISAGQVPFDVNYAEQLKTLMGNLQRNTNDGQTRMALGMVRRALDDTPLMQQAPQAAPGGIPMLGGAGGTNLGQESIDAFNAARQAARERFAWQESGRPVTQAIGGAQPDDFFQKYVIKGTVADARNLANNVPVGETRDAIVNHLKDKALGGAADEVGKFSQSAYNKALSQIGDKKLALFFQPEEIENLKRVGRVASYTQVQPVGSAVNNSNSGALLLGRGLDMMRNIPVLGPMVSPAVQNVRATLQQRAAENVAPGLLGPVQRDPVMRGLLNPALAYTGGLLAPPP